MPKSIEVENLKEATINMFNFVHDVLVDIANESEEWTKAFEEEWDLYAKDLEEV